MYDLLVTIISLKHNIIMIKSKKIHKFDTM